MAEVRMAANAAALWWADKIAQRASYPFSQIREFKRILAIYIDRKLAKSPGSSVIITTDELVDEECASKMMQIAKKCNIQTCDLPIFATMWIDEGNVRACENYGVQEYVISTTTTKVDSDDAK